MHRLTVGIFSLVNDLILKMNQNYELILFYT